MNWRCCAEHFTNKLCSETPDWETEPYVNENGVALGGVCKLSPETCGKCTTAQEFWVKLPEEIKEKVAHPTHIETIIPIKAEEGKPASKPKSAKAKKLEQEMMQRSMF